ncbi:hypothetical protein A4R35_00485 [Thermogemmatispora tikiterensis]|uniref:Uncharacterized protein n=1 Tax=Thermogemmatispora tikiterensis TaxID=1825093 RepID=A0A328V8Q5_9CHLR|nr:hypothetical protein A4R35_00485 [Thermogemmatispora tikiterensis]
MTGLLRLPPLLSMGIIVALAAYLVYRLVHAGTLQPLTIILLALLAFIFVRLLFRLRSRGNESESND